MSLLGHLVPEWRREEAATQALGYLLRAPDMASAFVDLLSPMGVPAFEPRGVGQSPSQKSDSRLGLTVRDADGTHRVSVEAVFWDDVHEVQPAEYLRLPAGGPSALVFVAPRDRTRSLWDVLRARCDADPELEVGLESRAGEAIWAPVAARVLVVTSWTSVLDKLQGAADDVTGQDVLQLQGLTDRIDREAFPPLKEADVRNVALARRIVNYERLVDEISACLQQQGLARNGRYSAGSYRTGRGANQPMLVHERLAMRLGIELQAWRDSRITPLWWVLERAATYSIEGDWQVIRRELKDVRSYGDSLYIPIRLKAGVEEPDVVADAVRQMRDIAEQLLEISESREE